MKKLIVVFAVFIISCSKKQNVCENAAGSDSIISSDANLSEDSLSDSGKINSDPESSASITGNSRSAENGQTTTTINAEMLPLTLNEEFTDKQQSYIIKIENFSGESISGEIVPENPQMNIRFNQIRLPDGTLDGPFSREISYKTPDKGEIWLIVGKSNMASGVSTGKFTVKIK
ncbi:hypothetical protein FIC_02296 [Flavobacteriaceae bacterium 3519-10]|nr:hypothetical protein FIC_02296 [Flavobacteriaceae bacterium 3519-10]